MLLRCTVYMPKRQTSHTHTFPLHYMAMKILTANVCGKHVCRGNYKPYICIHRRFLEQLASPSTENESVCFRRFFMMVVSWLRYWNLYLVVSRARIKSLLIHRHTHVCSSESEKKKNQQRLFFHSLLNIFPSSELHSENGHLLRKVKSKCIITDYCY